jgi:hypothetical protein
MSNITDAHDPSVRFADTSPAKLGRQSPTHPHFSSCGVGS